MKKWLIITLFFTYLPACSMTEEPEHKGNFYKEQHSDQGEVDSFNLPKNAINDVVKGLSLALLKSSNFVNTKTPVAVASFVQLDDLSTTSWLGHQLVENMVHELQHHGLTVIDFKATGYISVTTEGDYVLSRDWTELPERQLIDYVVTGTMVEKNNGVMVNVRMIGLQSKVIVATAQSFIPAWMIGELKSVKPMVVQVEEPILNQTGLIIRDNSSTNESGRSVRMKE
jgi:TolB-like protein